MCGEHKDFPSCELLRLLDELHYWQKKHGFDLESVSQALINEIEDLMVPELGVNFDYDSFTEKVCLRGVEPTVWLSQCVSPVEMV